MLQHRLIYAATLAVALLAAAVQPVDAAAPATASWADGGSGAVDRQESAPACDGLGEVGPAP